jgi:hypothetical protein
MRSVRWLPRERKPEPVEQRPWLEAPSPWGYPPREMPRAESREEEDDSPRVIVIEM